ncbi:MAG: hypothetical protein ACRC3H_23995 [Lachnospiraceae bacterium]
MIKRLNKSKAIYITVTVLELMLLAGSYAVDYFTRKKMGMARYVIYKNFQWEERYPVEMLKYVSAGGLVLMVLILILLLVKKRKSIRKYYYWMTAVSVFLSAWTVCFLLTGSREVQRSYYFVAILLTAGAAIQAIKSLAVMIAVRNEK